MRRLDAEALEEPGPPDSLSRAELWAELRGCQGELDQLGFQFDALRRNYEAARRDLEAVRTTRDALLAGSI